MSIFTALSIVLDLSNNEDGFKKLLEMHLLKTEDICILNRKCLNHLVDINKSKDNTKIEIKNELFFGKQNIMLDEYFEDALDYYFNCKTKSNNFSDEIKANDLNLNEKKSILNNAMILLNTFFFKASFSDLETIKEADFESLNLKAFQIKYKNDLLITFIFPLKVSIENKLDLNIIQHILENFTSAKNTDDKDSYLKKLLLSSLTEIKIQSEFEVFYFKLKTELYYLII